MILQKLTTEEFYKTHEELLLKPELKIIYTIHDKTVVDYGYENDCNIDWCNENNIPVTYFNRGGGCIVNCSGNITLAYICKFNGRWLASDIIKALIEFLKTKDLNPKYSRNDIMIDGFKVASGVCRNIRPDYKWQIGGIQVSINQDLNVIMNVCKKKMLKVPKGLSDFNITTEDIENWIIDYFSLTI